MIRYPSIQGLANEFKTSTFLISKVIDEVLPILVEFFSQYIPNQKISITTSQLSPNISYIIDNTIHKTNRPSVNQEEDYNGHYQMHGRQTQLLIDYDSNIIAFVTNIPGKIHDSLMAIYNKHFKQIINYDFALGDPGFQGVSYSVAGFKACQIETRSQRIFTTVTKREQVLIENVNNFIKKCKSINKSDTFHHNKAKLVACVFICVGMYNYKHWIGYYK